MLDNNLLLNLTAGVQVALGSFEANDLSDEQENSYPVKAGVVVNIAREFFLTTLKGFKHGCKLAGMADQGLTLVGTPLAQGSPVRPLLGAMTSAKNLVVLTETVSKLKAVFQPFQAWSSFVHSNGKDQKPGHCEQLLTKGAQLADWTMSVVETHQWLAKLGFVTAKTFAMGVIFNVASAVYLANSFKEEGAKWWTGKVVYQDATRTRDFDKNQQVKSLFLLTITAAYALMTAIAVAELAGYVVASSAFLMFASSATAWVAIAGHHLWEELVIQPSLKT